MIRNLHSIFSHLHTNLRTINRKSLKKIYLKETIKNPAIKTFMPTPCQSTNQKFQSQPKYFMQTKEKKSSRVL